MRMRLGILHDPEAQQRMHEREQRAAEEKKRKAEAPTVRTEIEQRRHEEEKARQQAQQSEDGGGKEEKREEKKKVKIRPLSDARAIELGANFFSETFIFAVAVALLLAENYRSRSKESARRDDVAERLEGLEAQVEELSSQHHLPELEALNEKFKRARERRERMAWYNPVGWFKGDGLDKDEDEDEGIPGEVEGPGGREEGRKSAANAAAVSASPEQNGREKEGARSQKVEGNAAKTPDTAQTKKEERIETVNAVGKGR